MFSIVQNSLNSTVAKKQLPQSLLNGGTEMIRTSDLAFRKRLPFVRYNADNKQNIDHGLYLYHDNPKQPTHCNINRAISPKVQHYVACGGYAMPVWGASQ